MLRLQALSLLEQTKENYNNTAEAYTRSRAFIPDDIKRLADMACAGDKILDMGSASGRFYSLLKEKNVQYFGVDISEKMIEIAKKDYPEANFIEANALNLPFENNFFDKVYSISVIHNIPSRDFQLEYLKEAWRALKPNGTIILRAWDFWRRKEGIFLYFKYAYLKILGINNLEFGDIFIPWRNSHGNIIANRYFHCFTKKEIKSLAQRAGFKVEKIWTEGQDPRTNIYLIATKK